jgi:Holliday junction resolvasome RuvABC endonuclease subunit
MQQKWLGIDPGLAIIGWAVLEGDETLQPRLIDCGVIETEKKLSTPARLVEIERDTIDLLQEFQPDRVAIEMPFFRCKLWELSIWLSIARSIVCLYFYINPVGNATSVMVKQIRQKWQKYYKDYSIYKNCRSTIVWMRSGLLWLRFKELEIRSIE